MMISGISRRGALGLATGAMAGLATAGARSQSMGSTTLRIGYLPLITNAQLFVMVQEHWPRRFGLVIELLPFRRDYELAAALTKPLEEGGVDAAYVDLGPVLTERSKGAEIQVVAANVIESLNVLVRGEVAEYVDMIDPLTGIRQYVRATGKPFRIATLPRGSVAFEVTHEWIFGANAGNLPPQDAKVLGANMLSVWRALLSDNGIEAAVAPQPIVQYILDRDETARVVGVGAMLLPDMPTNVVAVHRDTIRKRRPMLRNLVSMHIRATDLLRQEPERASVHLSAFIGFNRMDDAAIIRSLQQPYVRFEANPVLIENAALALEEQMLDHRRLADQVVLYDAINPSIYDEVVAGPSAPSVMELEAGASSGDL